MIAPHALQLLKRYEDTIEEQHGITLAEHMPVNWQDQVGAGTRDDYRRAGVDVDDPVQATAAFVGALDLFDTVMTAGMQAPGAVLYELRVLHFLADCAEGTHVDLAEFEPAKTSFWRRFVHHLARK